MSEQRKEFPEFYVTSPQPCPYLEGRLERKLFTHLTADKTGTVIDNMLRGGFRRSQHIAYLPYCDGCSACVSVRVPAETFAPTRSQRRVFKANVDLVGRAVPTQATSEQYDLFRNYIDARHGAGGMSEMTVLDFGAMVEDTTVDTHLVEYRIRPPLGLPEEFDTWPLIGCALVDLLSDGLSMVYSFFDPDQPRRSLGTFMVLDNIARTSRLALPCLYLGYWVEGSPSMDYKTRFQPQEHLGPDGWVIWDDGDRAP